MNYPIMRTATAMLVSCIVGATLNTANANSVDHRTANFDLRTSLNCSPAKQECIDLPQQARPSSQSSAFLQPQPEMLPTHILGDNYELVKFISEPYAARQPIEIETAGSYEIILTDLSSSGSLMKLKAKLTTDDGNLARIIGEGSIIFDAVPGTYYLSMFANAGWQTSQGTFSLTVQPYAVSSVPVPAAAWLFGSSLIGLAGMVRRKA